MNLEITGKLIKKLPEQTGEGKFGKWIKQDFVIETSDQYPKKVCFSTWGDKTDMLKKFNEGDVLTVSFNPESREYNERWYTDLRAWKIVNAQENAKPEDVPPPFTDDDIPPPEEEDIPF